MKSSPSEKSCKPLVAGFGLCPISIIMKTLGRRIGYLLSILVLHHKSTNTQVPALAKDFGGQLMHGVLNLGERLELIALKSLVVYIKLNLLSIYLT